MSHQNPFLNIFRLAMSSCEDTEAALDQEVAANLDDFGITIIGKSKPVDLAEIIESNIAANRATLDIEPGGLLDTY